MVDMTGQTKGCSVGWSSCLLRGRVRDVAQGSEGATSDHLGLVVGGNYPRHKLDEMVDVGRQIRKI